MRSECCALLRSPLYSLCVRLSPRACLGYRALGETSRPVDHPRRRQEHPAKWKVLVEGFAASEEKEVEGETEEISEDNHDIVGDEKIELLSAQTCCQDINKLL